MAEFFWKNCQIKKNAHLLCSMYDNCVWVTLPFVYADYYGGIYSFPLAVGLVAVPATIHDTSMSLYLKHTARNCFITAWAGHCKPALIHTSLQDASLSTNFPFIYWNLGHFESESQLAETAHQMSLAKTRFVEIKKHLKLYFQPNSYHLVAGIMANSSAAASQQNGNGHWNNPYCWLTFCQVIAATANSNIIGFYENTLWHSSLRWWCGGAYLTALPQFILPATSTYPWTDGAGLFISNMNLVLKASIFREHASLLRSVSMGGGGPWQVTASDRHQGFLLGGLQRPRCCCMTWIQIRPKIVSLWILPSSLLAPAASFNRHFICTFISILNYEDTWDSLSGLRFKRLGGDENSTFMNISWGRLLLSWWPDVRYFQNLSWFITGKYSTL